MKKSLMASRPHDRSLSRTLSGHTRHGAAERNRSFVTHFDILAGSFAAAHYDAQLEFAPRLATEPSTTGGAGARPEADSRDPVARDLMPE